MAYCTACYKEHKSHNPTNTFAKCTGCGLWNGLKFKYDAPFVYSCKQCHNVVKTHNKITTFAKCVSCGLWNGLSK